MIPHEGDPGVVGDLRDVGEDTVAAEGEDAGGAQDQAARAERGVGAHAQCTAIGRDIPG